MPSFDEMLDAALRERETVQEETRWYPNARINVEGDCFEFVESDEPYWADRVDHRTTLLRRFGDDKVIGWVISGISELPPWMFRSHRHAA